MDARPISDNDFARRAEMSFRLGLEIMAALEVNEAIRHVYNGQQCIPVTSNTIALLGALFV